MGITVAWGDEQQTLICMTYQGHWSNEEFRNAGMQVVLMMRTVSHPIYIVNDFSTSEIAPLGSLWQGRNLSRMRPPNWAGAVVITADEMLINLVDIFMTVYMAISHRQSLFFARTYEEALEIIARLKRENRVS